MFNRALKYALLSGAALLALGMSGASAQQTIAPASATPTNPMPDVLARYSPVTAERLKNPEDGNWLLFRRTYDGWGYSPLSQITPANVGNLELVWSFATGQVEGHQAPPIVNNGVMFVATPGNQVLAIEAKTGALLWRYKRTLPDDLTNLHPTSRGVGLLGDKLYFASADAQLVAIDAKTGKELWVTKVANYHDGYYMSLMPLVADGKVMLGTSGGELGVRGFVAAYDADTGKELWRTYTVPAPGQPGSETWPQGEQWKTGGGSIWVPGTYDAETNLAFWGTGNGGPWMGDQRPGDNLYTSSVVALDGKTGAIKGHFQYHQNDSWDWDEVSPPILVPYKFEGRDVKGLVDVARDGFLWRLERTDGKINFVSGQPFVAHNVFKGVEPKTGRPIVDLEHKPGTDKTATFCPSLWGGKDWPPVAYSPKTKLLYIPGEREFVHRVARREGEIRSRRALRRRCSEHDAHGRRCRPRRRAAGLGSRRRQEGVDHQAAVAELGPGARDRRRRAVLRRHQRPHVPRLRCQDRRDPLAVPDAVGRQRRAGLLRDRRQAVHRRAVGLGRRRPAHAGPPQPALPRQVPAGAARRRGLRLCAEVTAQSPPVARMSAATSGNGLGGKFG